jgi:SAM-dependent methyltransferase
MSSTVTPEKKTFFATYDWAKGWQDLPWAHDEPTLFLAEISQLRRASGRPGRALDIGCGAGTDSVFLARAGWEVTSLDFMPKALAYTGQRAAEAGVTVRLVEADITEWQPDGPYDLVLDHGLLHNMDPVRYPAYRERVLKALAGVAGMPVEQHEVPVVGQGNGRMGPNRVSREDIQKFFAPELQERFFAREEYEDLPDLVGGGMSQAYYWFRRNQAHHRPGELLEQIHRTLKRHSADADRLLGEAGDEPLSPALAPAHMARILGPGRLGISHQVPEPGSVAAVLADYARHAGTSATRLSNLLTFFGSAKLANVCNEGAPRCSECDVGFCKRLRYR